MLIAAALAIFILVGSIIPDRSAAGIPHTDKAIHLLAYFGLGLFVFPALSRQKPLFILALLIGFGAFIEILQASMGLGRNGDILDAFANAGGAICAYIFWTGATKAGSSRL